MRRQIPDAKAYQKILGTFKKSRSGITPADVAAGTGISLNQVKALLPLAADEYSARLEVTGSGEILYSFPRPFKSRYRGAVPALKKFFAAFGRFASRAGILLFKAWIMVMLLGYFLLFITIAVASILVSLAGSRDNRRGGGGMHVSFGIFDLIIRLWFYSELLNMGRGGRTAWQPSRSGAKKKGRPLHRAIFSFVFGDDDPNGGRETLEKREFVSYLRKRRGVVSLPELMILAGQKPETAESFIKQLCSEFGGSPEVTGEGTIVYRFDEILLSGEQKTPENENTSAVSGSVLPLYKKLRPFSSNPQKMNFWFGLINGVNLLFGGYFLHASLTTGHILSEAALRSAGIYGQVYYFLTVAGLQALPVIQIGLGLVPLLFSAFFWLIPALRLYLLNKENNNIRFDNFRGLFYSRVWASPQAFKPADVEPREDANRPRNLAAARERALKEMAAYSIPEAALDDDQKEVFDFAELRREKDALKKYRLTIDPAKSLPGETVFDSGA